MMVTFLFQNWQASKEEINNAFRKMSRIYHPDKHTSEETKIKAETLFNKIKKAHEGLFSHNYCVYLQKVL